MLNWFKKKIRTIEDRRAYSRGYIAGVKRGYEQGILAAQLGVALKRKPQREVRK